MLQSEGCSTQPAASKASPQRKQAIQPQPQQFQQLLDQPPDSTHAFQLQQSLLQPQSDAQVQQQQPALAAVLQALAGNPALALGALLQLMPNTTSTAAAAAAASPAAAAPAELASSSAALVAAQASWALGQLLNHQHQQQRPCLEDEHQQLALFKKRRLEPEQQQQLASGVEQKKTKLLLDVSSTAAHDMEWRSSNGIEQQRQLQQGQKDGLPQQLRQQPVQPQQQQQQQQGRHLAALQDSTVVTPSSAGPLQAGNTGQQAVQAGEMLSQWLQHNTSQAHANLTTDQQLTSITLSYGAEAGHMVAELGTTLLRALETEYQAVDALLSFATEAVAGEADACVALISVTAVGISARKEPQFGEQQQQLLERILQRCMEANPSLHSVRLTLSVGATAVSWNPEQGVQQLTCALQQTHSSAAAPLGDDHDIAAALLLLSGSQPPVSAPNSHEVHTPLVQLVQLSSAQKTSVEIEVPWYSRAAPSRTVLASGAQAAAQLEASVAPDSSSSRRVLQVQVPAGTLCEEGLYRLLVACDGAWFVAALVGCLDVQHEDSLKEVEAWLSQDPNLVTHFELFHASTLAPDNLALQHKVHLQRPATTVFNILDFLVGSCIHPSRPAVLRVLLAMLDRIRGSEVCASFVRSRQMSFELFGSDNSEMSQVIWEFIQQHVQHSYADQLDISSQWQQQVHPAAVMHFSSGDGSSTASYNVHAAIAAAAATGQAYSAGSAAAPGPIDESGQTQGQQQQAVAAHMAQALSNPAATQALRTQPAPSSKLPSSSPRRPAASRGGAATAAAGGGSAGVAAALPNALDLNLPKPKVKSWQLNALSGQGIEGDQEISMNFYMKRGPQAMRRTLVRRLTVMFPEVDIVYTNINKKAGLSQKGQQWLQGHCEEFFTYVLGPQHCPGSAPWPHTKELKPVAELGYISRLLAWMAGRDISAEDVNSCFIPGHHDWKVDPIRLEALLGVPVQSIQVPLYPLPTISAAAVSVHCDPAAVAAMQVPAAVAAAGASGTPADAGGWGFTAAAAAETPGAAAVLSAADPATAAAFTRPAAEVLPDLVEVAADATAQGAAGAEGKLAPAAAAAAARVGAEAVALPAAAAAAPSVAKHEFAAAIASMAVGPAATGSPAVAAASLAVNPSGVFAAAAAAMVHALLPPPAAAATSPPAKGIPVGFPAAGLPVAPLGQQAPTAAVAPAAP